MMKQDPARMLPVRYRPEPEPQRVSPADDASSLVRARLAITGLLVAVVGGWAFTAQIASAVTAPAP
jgi:hypothetical protein